MYQCLDTSYQTKEWKFRACIRKLLTPRPWKKVLFRFIFWASLEKWLPLTFQIQSSEFWKDIYANYLTFVKEVIVIFSHDPWSVRSWPLNPYSLPVSVAFSHFSHLSVIFLLESSLWLWRFERDALENLSGFLVRKPGLQHAAKLKDSRPDHITTPISKCLKNNYLNLIHTLITEGKVRLGWVRLGYKLLHSFSGGELI